MVENLEGRLDRPQVMMFKSQGERRIAEALNAYGIPFVYEPHLLLTVHGAQRRFRPDFYLPTQRLYIEYYGRIGNPDYDQRVQTKNHAYQTNQINVMHIYPWDLCTNWPTNLINGINSHQSVERPQAPTGIYHVPVRSSRPAQYKSTIQTRPYARARRPNY